MPDQYQVRVYIPNGKHRPQNSSWAWEVLLWSPRRYLLGAGQEATQVKAIDRALSLLTHVEAQADASAKWTPIASLRKLLPALRAGEA